MIFHVNPTIFTIHLFKYPLEIRWYGLMYVIGFLLAFFYLRYWFKKDYFKNKLNLPVDFHYDVIFWAAIGVILGGRLGYVLIYNFSSYIKNPLDIIKVWQGGMSFHGGMIGAILAIYIYCKTSRYDFFRLADKAVVIVPIGLFFGRIGNFINGELFGRPSTVPWAVIFPSGGNIMRHPSQIYEALTEGLILFLVLFFLERKQDFYYKELYKMEKSKKHPVKTVENKGILLRKGIIFWMFIGLYGLFRYLMEFFRQPDANMGINGYYAHGWTMGQFLSFPMFILGIIMVILVQKGIVEYKDIVHTEKEKKEKGNENSEK